MIKQSNYAWATGLILLVADLCVYLAGRGDPAWIRDDLAADLPEPALCREGLFISRSATEVRWLTPTEHAQLLREILARSASAGQRARARWV